MSNAAIYQHGEQSIKVVGNRAAVWTPKADFFGRETVTRFVNVEMAGSFIKEGTCIGSRTFKTPAGALKFSNRHLSAGK